MEHYYVEYSVIQKAIHIDTLERIKEFNNSLCQRGMSNGYVIIAGPMNLEEAFLYDPKLGGLSE